VVNTGQTLVKDHGQSLNIRAPDKKEFGQLISSLEEFQFSCVQIVVWMWLAVVNA